MITPSIREHCQSLALVCQLNHVFFVGTMYDPAEKRVETVHNFRSRTRNAPLEFLGVMLRLYEAGKAEFVAV